MNKPDTLTIYPNRLTLLFGVLGSVAFVVIALVILRRDEVALSKTVVLWAGLLFFGFGIFACGFMLARNLLRRRPMLVLNAQGITFFDGKGSPYYLAWKQVAGFREFSFARQKFILIDVQHPEALIDAEAGVIRRKLMEYNFKQFGTPFNIAPGNLNYPQKKLLPTLEEYRLKYR